MWKMALNPLVTGIPVTAPAFAQNAKMPGHPRCDPNFPQDDHVRDDNAKSEGPVRSRGAFLPVPRIVTSQRSNR